jgi:hypothetical protein
MLFIIRVLSMILTAIRPTEYTHAVHLVKLPSSLIGGAIYPSEGPLAMFFA